MADQGKCRSNKEKGERKEANKSARVPPPYIPTAEAMSAVLAATEIRSRPLTQADLRAPVGYTPPKQPHKHADMPVIWTTADDGDLPQLSKDSQEIIEDLWQRLREDAELDRRRNPNRATPPTIRHEKEGFGKTFKRILIQLLSFNNMHLSIWAREELLALYRADVIGPFYAMQVRQLLSLVFSHNPKVRRSLRPVDRHDDVFFTKYKDTIGVNEDVLEYLRVTEMCAEAKYRGYCWSKLARMLLRELRRDFPDRKALSKSKGTWDAVEIGFVLSTLMEGYRMS